MNSYPKISIIVPVYNSEKFLHKCIKSILAQTFIDFELLLINDGSKDNSGKICEEFVKTDARIKAFHQSNCGVSTARNKGLDNSCGKYICFIDSDDWVDENYLRDFFDAPSMEEKFTFVIQDVLQEFDNKTSILCNFSERTFCKEEFSMLFSQFELFRFGYPFSKLYNAEIIKINNIRFDERIEFKEDLIFMLEYIKHLSVISIKSKTNYHYSSNNNSLKERDKLYESEILCFCTLKKLNRDLNEIFKFDQKAINSIQNYLGLSLINLIHSVYRPKHRKKYFDRISILKKIITYENIQILSSYQRNKKNIIFSIPILLFKFKMPYLIDLFYIIAFPLRYKCNKIWVKVSPKIWT